MDNKAQNASGYQRSDHWARLDAFLQTDPRDAGCDEAMEMLDVYAELLAAGNDPSERFPGVHAHFLACGPCAQDLEGLLSALTGPASSQPGPP
ncbi:hypothetical protein Pth03_82820 [Planotetraspora thailandica]|uniref:Uncharacterized protein n=1 Tax=Planotetraspora thailandica TaxID=487172 RepID=A0A8J4DFP5_9ACTN|nr:hypothetical protein [Planotetraspora thailandica]GII59893.1 hypothetical protein Pth03_82820 [Planotetraspora thailandica]